MSEMDDKLNNNGIPNYSVSEAVEKRTRPKMTKAQSIWVHLWCCIPWGNYIFGSYDLPATMKNQQKWKLFAIPKTGNVKIRGMCNLFNIQDTFFCSWVRYLDDDPNFDEEAAKKKIISDCQNIGLMSALISTICFSLLVLATQEDEFDSTVTGKLFVLFWTSSSVATLLSTGISILLVMALDESGGPKETAYFIELLKYVSFGVGVWTPLLLLYVGFVFATGGLVVGLFKFFSRTTLWISVIGVFLVGAIFVVFYVNMVPALRATREMKTNLNKNTQKVSLTYDDIKELLKDCNNSLYIIITII
jgi:hypothetical protein